MKHLLDIETEADVEEVIKELQRRARELSLLASEYGLVLTIETVPRYPLAMGNYFIQCEIRAGRAIYRGQA